MPRLLVFVSLLLITTFAFGQAPDDSLDRGESAESLLEQVETEHDDTELADQLDWLTDHPINLNTATKKDLASIPILTPAEIDAIIGARRKVTRFASVEHLAFIDDVGETVLSKIRPFVYVPTEGKAYSPGLRFISRVTRDLQPREGFQSGAYVGSPIKNYSRMTYEQSENVQAGVLVEKDAGEKLIDGFVSGYANVHDVGFVTNAVVGDYVVEAGQGLVFWRASAYGKGSETMSIVKKNGRTVQPYRSADEFNFFRGVAATTSVDFGESRLNLTALFSRRSLAASSDSASFTSFYEAGLFRTELEIKKQATVTEKLVGGRVEFESTEDWTVGATFYRTSFSKPTAPSRTFEFSGSSSSAVGIDAMVHLGWVSPRLSQMTLFGEAASVGPKSASGVVGAIVNLTRSTSAVFVYRDYSPGFASLHASGFGERSDTKNERGFYVGVDARPAKGLRVSAYLDHFSFPWRTFDNPLPSSGRDFLLQADASVTKALGLSARYSNKQTETVETLSDDLARETRLQVDRRQQKLRFTGSYQASKRIRLRGRIEATLVTHDMSGVTEKGFLFYQDLQCVLSPQLKAEARLAFFDTESYESRLYEYENDLRGVFANPALYGKGRRWYVLIHWKIADAVDISAKYSATQKEGVATLGSGDSEIRNDIDNRLGLQVDVRF